VKEEIKTNVDATPYSTYVLRELEEMNEKLKRQNDMLKKIKEELKKENAALKQLLEKEKKS